LVDEYVDYNCFNEVSFLILMKVSKGNEEHHQLLRKLKKKATETFEMLKSAYSE
jgi:hypothetical protein